MSVRIDQAFVQAFIGGNLGLRIAHENMPFDPEESDIPVHVSGYDAAYAELLNLPNDITPFSLADSDETDGLFRVILRYPSGSGAIAAKKMADRVMSLFPIGSQVCYEGQCATVTGRRREPGTPEAGWYKVLVTIFYRAFIRRNES